MNNLISVNHSIGQLTYHIEFCPKYRYNMFKQDDIKKDCEAILRNIAGRNKIGIIEIAVCDDHVHMVVSLRPAMSLSQAEHRLKGASAYELFRMHPNFRKRYPQGHFWSPGTFHRSVGDTDLETVTHYVQKQKTLFDFN